MDLTTEARVEALGEINADWRVSTKRSAWMSQAITAWSNRAEDYLRRKTTAATYTEYLDVAAGQAVFSLKAFPVTTMSAVYQDTSRSFSGVSAISSALYSCITGSGLLRVDQYGLMRGLASLKVVYAGGMASTTSAFVSAFPDVADGLDRQIVHVWNRRKDQGATVTTAGPGTMQWDGEVSWLKDVRAVLDNHRRYSFGG